MRRWSYFSASVPPPSVTAGAPGVAVDARPPVDGRAHVGRMACECGRRKSHSNREACDRCLWLDGVRAQANLIAALRRAGRGLTAAELADEAGMAFVESVRRSMDRLVASGRARRWWREFEIPVTVAAPGSQVGRGETREATGTGGCWVYSLR